MTIDGEVSDPFSAETLRVLPPPHSSLKQKIINVSRKKYSLPVELVKKMIAEEEKLVSQNIQKPLPEEQKDKNNEKKESKEEPLI